MRVLAAAVPRSVRQIDVAGSPSRFVSVQAAEAGRVKFSHRCQWRWCLRHLRPCPHVLHHGEPQLRRRGISAPEPPFRVFPMAPENSMHPWLVREGHASSCS